VTPGPRGRRAAPAGDPLGGAEHTTGEGKNNGGTEVRVTPTVWVGREVMAAAGANATSAAHAFETRVSQGGTSH
jgi:hypothetical protein